MGTAGIVSMIRMLLLFLVTWPALAKSSLRFVRNPDEFVSALNNPTAPHVVITAPLDLTKAKFKYLGVGSISDGTPVRPKALVRSIRGQCPKEEGTPLAHPKLMYEPFRNDTCLVMVTETFIETWPVDVDAGENLLLLENLYIVKDSVASNDTIASSPLLLHWQGGLGVRNVVLQGTPSGNEVMQIEEGESGRSRAIHVKPGARLYVHESVFVGFEHSFAAAIRVEDFSSIAAFETVFQELNVFNGPDGLPADGMVQRGPVTVLVDNSRALFEQCTFRDLTELGTELVTESSQNSGIYILNRTAEFYAKPRLYASGYDGGNQTVESMDPPKASLFLQGADFTEIDLEYEAALAKEAPSIGLLILGVVVNSACVLLTLAVCHILDARRQRLKHEDCK